MTRKVRLTEKGISHIGDYTVYNPWSKPLRSLIGKDVGHGFYEFEIGWVDIFDEIHFSWHLSDNMVEVLE